MKRIYVVRYAYEDQHPPGTDLRAAAWDSLLRYARHFALTFNPREVWTMSGYRWRSDAPGEPAYPTDVAVRVDVHMHESPRRPRRENEEIDMTEMTHEDVAAGTYYTLLEAYGEKTAQRIEASASYGELVHRILERLQAGQLLGDMFDQLDRADFQAVPSAADPAAFLAAKVHALG